jgi:hypothetical protein
VDLEEGLGGDLELGGQELEAALLEASNNLTNLPSQDELNEIKKDSVRVHVGHRRA